MTDDVIRDPLSPADVAAIRQRMGLTQTALGEIMGVDLRTWMRKEANPDDLVSKYDSSRLNIGETNFLLLLADEHPVWRLKNYSPEKVFPKVIREQPSADEVKELRTALGMKQQEIADMLGYTLAAWKSKQSKANSGTLKPGEYNFLMLLANVHPGLKLTKRT